MDPSVGRASRTLDLSRGEIPWGVFSSHLESLDAGAVLRRGFNYSSPAGLDDLRELFVDRFATCAVHVDDTLVTGGALGALDLALRALLRDRPAARLVVLEPTYREALGIAKAIGLPVVAWSKLAGVLSRDDVVYVVSTFNNPDGRTISAAERDNLAAAIVEADAALIEDAAYDLLAAVSADQVPGVCATVTQRRGNAWALRLMSFSKTVVPGARVCVVEGSARALAAMRTVKFDFGTSPVACALVAELVRDPRTLDRHLALIRERLGRGRAAADQAFRAWDRPPSVVGAGYFLWLPSSHVSSTEAAVRATAVGVRVSDGAPFFVDHRPTHLRLSVAWEPAERIHEACLRLEESVAAPKNLLEETS